MKTTIITLAAISVFSFVKAQSVDIDIFRYRFIPGIYYTHTGESFTGDIKLKCTATFLKGPHNSISVKGIDGKKVKLTVKEIKAFVIGRDSFAIVRDFQHGVAKFDEDFAHIDEVNGDITTVTHFTTIGSDHQTTGRTMYVRNGTCYDTMELAKKAE